MCSCAYTGLMQNSESLERWLIALNLPPQLLMTLLFFRWSILIFTQKLPVKLAWTDTCAAVKWFSAFLLIDYSLSFSWCLPIQLEQYKSIRLWISRGRKLGYLNQKRPILAFTIWIFGVPPFLCLHLFVHITHSTFKTWRFLQKGVILHKKLFSTELIRAHFRHPASKDMILQRKRI